MSDPMSTPEADSAAAPKAEASVEATRAAKTAVEASAETVEEISSAADAVIDRVTASQQQALDTLETASATMLESVARVQRRIAEFVSDRIRQDMEAQQELLRCKSLDEVRDVQTRFFRTAVTQYSEEASRLFRMGGEAIGRSVERID
ncbi:phasin family protein [Amaricoccus sp.]|uniref:phasin family protein n=1 Tax=Amaricoccus sp. TaxID=1872485 RepID=UPI001B7221C5|nr:phasin family protein [Amaricoccus sp.]MBP7002912.1 phasin family protein [Amaricoccus sp.]